MPFKEKKIEKLYYSIGEVAALFEVAPSLIRFWETEFDNLKPRKNSKGNRQYSKEDIEEIELIYHLLKEKGFTISGAKEKIKQDKRKAQDRLEAIKSLEKVKQFLMDLKKQL